MDEGGLDRTRPVAQASEHRSIGRRNFLRRAGITSAVTLAAVGLRDLSGTSRAQAATMRPGVREMPDGFEKPSGPMSPDCTCIRWVDYVHCTGCCGPCPKSGQCCYEVYYNSVPSHFACIAQHCNCCNMHSCLLQAC